jgi:hypothetical protein
MGEELAAVPQDTAAALHCPGKSRDSLVAQHLYRDLAALHTDWMDPMADLAALHTDWTDPMADLHRVVEVLHTALTLDLPQPLAALHMDQSVSPQATMAVVALHMDWVDSLDNYLDLSQAGLTHTPSPGTFVAAAHPDYHHRRWGCDSSVFFSLDYTAEEVQSPGTAFALPPDIYGMAIIL